MRFERLFTEADAFANQISAHQTRDRGVNVDNGTAREVQRAVRRQQTATPDHVRNRHIGERQPDHHEDQDRRETNALGERAHNQPDGNAGERALERHVNILIEAAHQRGQFNVFQHHPVEVTKERVTRAERQRVTVNHPKHADQCKRHGNLRQHGENVFATDQTAVEQRNARNGHEQHQRGADHHKGVIGFVGHRRGSSQRQARQQRQRTQTRFKCCYLHFLDPYHCVPGVNYSAASSDSPVRMRMTRCSSATKILPSPILPV